MKRILEHIEATGVLNEESRLVPGALIEKYHTDLSRFAWRILNNDYMSLEGRLAFNLPPLTVAYVLKREMKEGKNARL